MRVAVVGLDVDMELRHEARVSRAAGLVRQQQTADLVVLPELWAHGAFAYDSWAASAEPLDGPTVTAMAEAAADIDAYVLAGSVIERAADGGLYNTAVLLDPAGALVASYRKIHRFGFGQGEATALGRGHEVVTCKVGDAVLGIAICYDLRFPELFRALVDAGATVLALPSSWPDKRIEHWRVLSQARAIESQAYLLACNAVGSHSGYTLGGHSAVIDPWGQVLAESGPTEESLVLDIDPGYVLKTRETFPVLPDRVL